MHRSELEKKTVKELRQLALKKGFSFAHMSEMKKHELVRLIVEAFAFVRSEIEKDAKLSARNSSKAECPHTEGTNEHTIWMDAYKVEQETVSEENDLIYDRYQ